MARAAVVGLGGGKGPNKSVSEFLPVTGSQRLGKVLKLFESLWKFLDVLGCIPTRSGAFGCLVVKQKRPENPNEHFGKPYGFLKCF